ncbi:unnamed protein product [marine sediment metagenome]|uniref:DUF5681 domain-containing protein n=1 Tax=marine sediment metagenome TaxID=412755 RepID=X0VPU6_9ZZZZ
MTDRDDRGRFVKGNGAGFKSGQTGNPNGRPHEPSLWHEIKKLLPEEAVIDSGKTGKTWMALAAKSFLLGCIQGNPTLLKELGSRLDGLVPQQVQLSGKEGAEPIKFVEIVKDHGDGSKDTTV